MESAMHFIMSLTVISIGAATLLEFLRAGLLITAYFVDQGSYYGMLKRERDKLYEDFIYGRGTLKRLVFTIQWVCYAFVLFLFCYWKEIPMWFAILAGVGVSLELVWKLGFVYLPVRLFPHKVVYKN